MECAGGGGRAPLCTHVEALSEHESVIKSPDETLGLCSWAAGPSAAWGGHVVSPRSGSLLGQLEQQGPPAAVLQGCLGTAPLSC